MILLSLVLKNTHGNLFCSSIGPCGDRQWLVLGFRDVPQCQDIGCPDKQIRYKGRCVNLKDEPSCPPGMHIVATVMGLGDCDCQDGQVYWINKTNSQQVMITSFFFFFFYHLKHLNIGQIILYA